MPSNISCYNKTLPHKTTSPLASVLVEQAGINPEIRYLPQSFTFSAKDGSSQQITSGINKICTNKITLNLQAEPRKTTADVLSETRRCQRPKS